MSVRPKGPLRHRGQLVLSPGAPGPIDLVLDLYTTGDLNEKAEAEYLIHKSPGFRLENGAKQGVTVSGRSTEARPDEVERPVQVVYEGTRRPPPPVVGVRARVTMPGTAIESVVVGVVPIRWNKRSGT